MYDDDILYHPVFDVGGVFFLEETEIPEPPVEMIVSAEQKKYIFRKGGSGQNTKKDVE